MENEFMPEELHAVTARLVTETVDRLQEVLLYSRATSELEWPRMLLYRTTDAQDTLGVLVGLYAAHALRAGCDPVDLRRYLQTRQQVARTELPRRQEFDYLDGLRGRPIGDAGSSHYITGKVHREHVGDSDRHREWTLACIHALRAFACADPDELDEVPASIRTKARRVYATLVYEGSEPEPAA
ncbi:hypothetical protein [Actinomadura sp. 9N215]|uniref:hypothetical protein n=1 Tax=Actinomadura sp. 9N215 TaxID=3375150 RepID=UPI0037ADF70E